MRRVVWISEDTEYEEDGEYLTGRFYGHVDTGELGDAFEDLSLEEAVEWGRARGDRVLIRIGYGRHVPLEHAELVSPVRRRVPDEGWKDRTDADPPVAWSATVRLTPPDPRAPRAELEAEVADSAAGAPWDGEELDEWLREYEEAERRLRAGAGRAFISESSPSFTVRITVDAPTRAAAIESARSRITEPAGWRVRVYAEPEA